MRRLPARPRRFLLAGLAAALLLPFTPVSASAQTVPAAVAPSPLSAVLERHGGLARWQGFGTVEYDLAWSFGPRQLHDHQLFDLTDRRGLVTAADGSYRLGSDGTDVWVAPNRAALAGGKMPPRFYLGTPFYFFAIPFVFADRDVKVVAQGRRPFEGKECDTFRVTFGAGVGDTPEDYYLLYADAATHETRLVAYVVTYPAMRGTKTIEELEPHALVYDEWQEADGLRVPRRGRFFNWDAKAEKLGEVRGTIEFTGVRFAADRPAPERFARPAGAETDALKP